MHVQFVRPGSAECAYDAKSSFVHVTSGPKASDVLSNFESIGRAENTTGGDFEIDPSVAFAATRTCEGRVVPSSPAPADS